MSVLIGPPTAGKSSVGRQVAQRLNARFIDVDARIEATTGQSVAQVFASAGEAGFRALEAATATSALAEAGTVVALGGGAVTSEWVRDMLADQTVVWLDVSLDEAIRRAEVQPDQRPLLSGDVAGKMTALLEARRGLYAGACTWRVDTTDKTTGQVVDEVLGCLQGFHDVIPVITEQAYGVVVERGALRRLAPFIAGASQIGVIASPALSHVAAAICDEIEAAGRRALLVEVPVGEAAKTPDVLASCWRVLAANDFTRADMVVGVGGGATTDLAGLVAATYLRGVEWVAAPTSVLGMVDAAIGGKTGIDVPEGKNLVGAFWEPRAVLADLDTLKTLPDVERRSGLAEAAKVGFTDDPVILDLIQSEESLAQVIARAVLVKAVVVADDLRERTSAPDAVVGRERLNYGHTLGHAIEAHENFTWRHGEAVAVGAVFAAEVAHRVLGLPASVVERHRAVFESLGLPTSYSGASWDQVRALMARDKKTRGTSLRMVLLKGLGDVVVATPDEAALADAYQAISRKV
ncbi:MAG: bifunctional shikimate kinase/3-dehydroquinate synthase [Micrococcales bacterium]|nr:bifunctional shikimate kinase/3-dehydroquinate synthase [Micrococcales bacterium]